MKMVHRDIKPENILYSQGSMQFVFGDFGMVALLGEQYWEKTLTKFVGTPNFCGEEMKPLLEGGSGHVNLYLNDFSSLKQTLNYFTSNFISQNSRISSNSMSYNQY
jgi:serine/threonine protein kinase